jgi:carbon monoxide dehydrogenase subunit G
MVVFIGISRYQTIGDIMSNKAPTEVDHLTSLANGRCAYVHLSNGQSLHVNTGSPAFVSAISNLVAEGHAKRVANQIARLAAANPQSCWPEVQSDLVASGVLAN